MKLKNKLKILYILTIIFTILALISPISYGQNTITNSNSIEETTTSKKELTDLEKEELLHKKLDIISESVTLIDSKTGTVIYSKDADKKMYPASTTKVMTAILAIENSKLDDIATVSSEAISPIPSGYSSAYLVKGEKMSVNDLLEIMLIHSANDAANVLAEHVSGTIDDFVDLMNKKAQELGCKNTHFVNTNGIQDENHYSTAEDLGIISQYCMQNETFRKYVAMKECSIPATNKSGKRAFKNTNDSLQKTSKYYRKDCIGIKTGYTSQAKNCLLSACTNDDIELIAVLLYSPHLADRYEDLDTLFEYGYEVYPLLEINKQEESTEPENESTNSEKKAYSKRFSVEALVKGHSIIGRIVRICLIIVLLGFLVFCLRKLTKND